MSIRINSVIEGLNILAGFKYDHTTVSINQNEKNLATQIYQLISEISRGHIDIVEDTCLLNEPEEDDLYFDSTEESSTSPRDETSTPEESDNSEEEVIHSPYKPSPIKVFRRPIHERYTLKTMQDIVKMCDKKGGAVRAFQRWKSLNNDYHTITRIREFVSKGGNRESKLQKVKEITYSKFVAARENFGPVQD